jgi:2,3,4,5-tetrahydropyridine-2,6-dicarboxylate N-succinyltransferase
MTSNAELRSIIEKAWEDRTLLQDAATLKAIDAVIASLDLGVLRVAEPTPSGWKVNENLRGRPFGVS